MGPAGGSEVSCTTKSFLNHHIMHSVDVSLNLSDLVISLR